MNIGIATYGTGAFSSIGSLSESAIVDFYGTGDLQPEKKLMLAVLQGAVECFKEYAEHDRLFKEAEEWIFEDDHDWPFSFINICQAVDMNPKYLRKGLLHLRQSAIPEAITLWPASSINIRVNAALKHHRRKEKMLPRKMSQNMGFYI